MASIDLINRRNFLPTKIPIKVPAEKVNEVLQRLNSITTDDGTLIADTIAESTSGAGVTIDGVLLKDGVVTSTGPSLESIATGITAFATGGQASATQLTEEYNNITTCTTAGDSVKLPTAIAGMEIFIKNSGVAALDIFPYTSDKIDALAINLAIRIQPGSTVKLFAIDAVTWESNSDGITLNSPTTLKGQLEFKAANNAGNTVTTITNASQAAVRTYTIPDAGTSANIVMSEGAATINGIKTFGSGIVLPVGAVGTPSVQIGAVDTGLYLVSAVQTGFAQDGVLVSVYDSEGIKPDSCQFRAAPGTLASAGVTVRHYGDGRDVTSVFTLINYIIGPLAGAAAAKVLIPPEALYIFPAGGHILAASRTSLGLTATGTAVTPDVGLGSVAGDGSAFAVLSSATVGITVEDILTGYAIADTVTHAAVASGPITPTAGALAGIALNKSGDSKNLFLNAAATWIADNTGNLTATGTITIKWTIM